MEIATTRKDTLNALKENVSFVRGNRYSKLYATLPSIDDATSLEAALTALPTTSRADVAAHATSLSHYPDEHVRFLPSEFEAERTDALFLLPQHIDAWWRTAYTHMQTQAPRVVMLSVPLFWQIGPLLYHTCRKYGVPVSAISPRNLPLARQVIAEVGADMVVTTPETAGELQHILADAQLKTQIRTWHLVTPIGMQSDIPALPGSVLLEYHLFPGIPIGHVPPEFIYEREQGFIPSPEYVFDIEEGVGHVTSLVPHALPLMRLEVPGMLSFSHASDTPRITCT